MSRFLGILIAALFAALIAPGCGPRSTTGGGDGGAGDGSLNDGAFSDGWLWDGRAGDGGPTCEPPDMLIVLDRTMSMHRRPDGTRPPDTTQGHQESKWYLAITALETVTAAYDERLRFGLELFPRDPGGGVCVTLSERINGTTATNPTCQEGEVPVMPAVGTSGAIDNALDPETTLLCTSTPIGAGLDTALTTLQSITDPIRDQYVLLVTDGRDTCNNPDPPERACALAQAGINTYVVGFDGSGSGIDPVMLNNMACAGMTAPDHAQNCVQSGGCYAAVDPSSGPTLYLAASDGAELNAHLDDVSSEVGCVVQ
jgi:hypothetical protein